MTYLFCIVIFEHTGTLQTLQWIIIQIRLIKAFISSSSWSQNNANFFAPPEYLKPNDILGGPKKCIKSSLLPNIAF